MKNTQDPYKRLVLAVVIQAARDWREYGMIDALVYLWQDAPNLLESAGATIGAETWHDWLAAGCPAKFHGGLTV